MNRSWDKDAGPSDHEPPVPPSAREQPQEQGREHALGEARREKKFSNKARLFVGNLPRDFSEQQLKELFQESGEVQEVFLNKEKNFGFVRMAYRSDAEKAISANHGKVIKNRDIKVRFAASSCSVKVSNLHPLVSNELLADAFSMFGEVENAVVVTDDRGKSLGYGIVEFARKNQAIAAIQKCKLENFLLTKTPIPVLVTEHTKDNDEEGQPEKSLPRNATFFSEREAPPRFAQPGSLEYDVAGRWKAHYDSEKMQREELEQRLKEGRNLLQQDMHNIKEQHQTLLLRQEIARHQQEQLRLAEELRKQEERMQGYYSQGGPQYHPGVNPMPAGSLVMPGAAVGGVEAGGENVATELMAIPTAMGGGIRPPATGAMPLFPSPLMGKSSFSSNP